MTAPIDFKAFRADFAAAVKELEAKYGISVGLGNITYDGETGAFRTQFEGAPVQLVEGIDIMKHAKLAEVSSLQGYFGKASFGKRVNYTGAGGDVVAIGYVPQRKLQCTAMVVTGPNKGKCFHVARTVFGF